MQSARNSVSPTALVPGYMNVTFRFALSLCLLVSFICSCAANPFIGPQVVTGAENTRAYFPLLKGKNIALIINQTSRIGSSILADSLLKEGFSVKRIFVPEHGFRGTADAGAHISNSRDSATGLPVVSLYGNNKKPKPDQLKDIDIVIYDLQDVGARFYTYISTLQYAMEACAENGKMLLVLDRPNPNAGYIDGPVLDTAYRSFVGMQPIPVVYGMTAGEYANMLKGEHWVKAADQLKMKVVSCVNYTHSTPYLLPVAPSPNLRSPNAITLYPSICFFEGTVVSLGRGTDKPFEQWGHPAFKGKGPDTFTPQSRVGATDPPLKGKQCYGRILESKDVYAAGGQLQLGGLIEAYKWYPDKSSFFIPYFETLAGTGQLRKQITEGWTEERIRKSWEPQLTAFKQIRKRYLLYKDFE